MNSINFEKIKQTVLPYFIKVYGEEYRDILTYRINQISPIFFTDKTTQINTNPEFFEFKDAMYSRYMIKFLVSIKNYMCEEDQIILDDYLNDKTNWAYLKDNLKILKLVGYDLYPSLTPNPFSSKFNDLDKLSEYQKQDILNRRKQYYKSLGFDENILTKEFLLGNHLIQVPSSTVVDKIIKEKEKYFELADKDMLKIINNYDSILKKIKQLNLTDEANIEKEIMDIFQNDDKCCMCHTSIIDKKPQLTVLLYFNPNSYSCMECVDTFLIHEINHAIESSLIYYKDGKSLYKSGFEYIDSGDNNLGKYKNLSENINQRIAIEITDLIHNDNVYIFDNPSAYKTSGSSIYEMYNEITDDFWNKYKKEIMKSRIDTSLDSLFEIFDKDEFDKLNNQLNADVDNKNFYNNKKM